MRKLLLIIIYIFQFSGEAYTSDLPKFSYDDSDYNLNRLYKLIMSNQSLLKESKYLNYSKKGKYKNDKIKTMALAVYINYEEELTKLTNDKYLEEIPVLAWGWEYSELDNNYYNGSRAVIDCDKDVIKKKLNNVGSKCIVVDFRRITGDSQYPITWENYLLKEREVKRLIAINIEKNNEIKKIEEKKKKELALVAQKKAEDEKVRKEKEQKLLAEKQKADELEKINKKLSLFNETELEKNQKIIDYTKKFIELYPDEFDILEIAKKILNVRPISDGNLNDKVLSYLNELRNFTSKSKKFSDYEQNIIKKENDQKVKTVDNELKILNEKIIVSKKFLAKNIDSVYAAELIELISNSEKIYFNPNSLQEIRKKNEDLNNLITQINNLNEKIKLTNDLNFLLKDKLQKNLSSDLTPLLIEQIEKLEYVLNNIEINSLNTVIEETNNFIENTLAETNAEIKKNKDAEIKITSNKNNTELNQTSSNKSDFIDIGTKKYLTTEAFKNNFNNKTIIIKHINPLEKEYGLEFMFTIDANKLLNFSDALNNGIKTDFYIWQNNRWRQEKINIFYIKDASLCDPKQRNICKEGAIYLFLDLNIFKDGFSIIDSNGYKFVAMTQIVEPSEGNSNKLKVTSPEAEHLIFFDVIELSENNNKISQIKDAENQLIKKNNKAKAKQTAFEERITLQCTYIGGAGMRTVTYQFDGKNVNFEGIPVELGVESNGLLVTREGASQKVQAILNNEGMIVEYEIDLKKQKAMSKVFGQIVMADCTKF